MIIYFTLFYNEEEEEEEDNEEDEDESTMTMYDYDYMQIRKVQEQRKIARKLLLKHKGKEEMKEKENLFERFASIEIKEEEDGDGEDDEHNHYEKGDDDRHHPSTSSSSSSNPSHFTASFKKRKLTNHDDGYNNNNNLSVKRYVKPLSSLSRLPVVVKTNEEEEQDEYDRDDFMLNSYRPIRNYNK